MNGFGQVHVFIFSKVNGGEFKFFLVVQRV